MTYRNARTVGRLVRYLERHGHPHDLVPASWSGGRCDPASLAAVALRFMQDDFFRDSGDTYQQMPTREALKIMEAEEFEPLVSDSVSGRGWITPDRIDVFARRRDGAVVRLLSRKGEMIDANLISFETGNGRVYPGEISARQEWIGFAPAEKGNRLLRREDVTFLLRFRLALLARATRPIPLWASFKEDGRPVPGVSPKALLTHEVEHDPATQARSEELLATRISAVPQEWREILDFEGTRTIGEALRAVSELSDVGQRRTDSGGEAIGTTQGVLPDNREELR